MPLLEDRNAAFIVRQWCERGDSGSTSVWRGSVEHVESGRRRFFQKYDVMVAFLRSVTPEFDPIPAQATTDTPSDIAVARSCPPTRNPPCP